MNNKIILISVLLCTFISTLLITKKLISWFSKRKIGQRILEIGPNWHKDKDGTPTMGGISFVIAFILGFLALCVLLAVQGQSNKILPVSIVVIFCVLNSLVGIIDDSAKIRRKKNEGIKPLTKLILQGISAVILLVGLTLSNKIDTDLKIPFLNLQFNLGFFYYILAFFVICGFINAVNLTDGIDGLASSVSLTVGVLMCFASVFIVNDEALSLVGGTIIGVTFAFLFFNLHPAQIFMGDTGSLFLGALIVSTSFLVNNPLLIVVFGFVFLCEAVSVILQVAYFKVTKGKRLFKMAPLHHHMEKSGWSEMKIVSVFTLVNGIFCILSYFALLK